MEIIISLEQSGMRIDRFLKETVFSGEGITRGQIIRDIKDGKVLVNNKLTKPSYILKEGDKIEVERKDKETKREIISNREIDLPIIYQDKNIIVIDKPAGRKVHPSCQTETDTLVNGLVDRFPEIRNVHDQSLDAWMRPGIVHRLDKDTSGVMVVTKNKKTYEKLKENFKNRKIEKTYWALVYGKLEKKEGMIDLPIARSTSYRKQVIASKKTKTKVRSALTEYRVIGEFGDYSLLEVKPKTGRMHQIRVHLTSIGHPIVGDRKYCLKSTKQIEKVTRHLLHAKSLRFSLDEKEYFFESLLPEDFKDFLAGLN